MPLSQPPLFLCETAFIRAVEMPPLVDFYGALCRERTVEGKVFRHATPPYKDRAEIVVIWLILPRTRARMLLPLCRNR